MASVKEVCQSIDGKITIEMSDGKINIVNLTDIQSLIYGEDTLSQEDINHTGLAIRRAVKGNKYFARVHPNYHCHYFGGNFFSDSGVIADLSGSGNNAINMSSFTGQIGGANPGYITNGTAANTMYDIPSLNFDPGASNESLLIHVDLKYTMPVATTTWIIANTTGGTTPGIRIGLNGDGSTGTAVQMLLYTSNGQVSGSSTIANGNSSVYDNKLHSFTIFINGRTKVWSAWLNSDRARTESSLTITGNAIGTNPLRIGGTYGVSTGSLAMQLRCLAMLKWSETDDLPSLSTIDIAVKKLRDRPHTVILDGEL